MDADKLRLYQEAMDNGYIELSTKKKRYRVFYDYQCYTVSHLIYFLFHPDEEPLGKDEEIHHRDHCAQNDHPDNLQRVTKQWHRLHHMREQQDSVSPVVINQIRRLWITGITQNKVIWRAIAKVIGYKMVGSVVQAHQKKWARQMGV
jgi:hypothetical protein